MNRHPNSRRNRQWRVMKIYNKPIRMFSRLEIEQNVSSVLGSSIMIGL